MTARDLLYALPNEYYEALRRRARRHFRSIRAELAAIVADVLQEEVEAIRAELAAEQPDEPTPSEEVKAE